MPSKACAPVADPRLKRLLSSRIRQPGKKSSRWPGVSHSVPNISYWLLKTEGMSTYEMVPGSAPSSNRRRYGLAMALWESSSSPRPY